MRTSKYLLYTIKEIPQKINSISYQLMLKSGLIRQTESGIYIWLPNGLRVLKNIKKIIKQEMKKINAIEFSFPIIQSDNLWQKSNRLIEYGSDLIQFQDRNKNKFILSPTHEEAMTLFIKKEINSYKKLPIIIYQIQKKFRDEIRPRAGVIRSREFIMKDAYSFHENQNSLNRIYRQMYFAYIKIFKKMNLKFYSIKADSGLIGGKYSHEFQALSYSGEDKIILLKHNVNNSINHQNKFIKEIKKKKCIYKKKYYKINKQYNENLKKIQLMYKKFKKQIIKTFIIKTIYKKQYQFIILMIRGDHKLDINKINNIPYITLQNNKLTLINKKSIYKIINKKEINFSISLIIDPYVACLKKILPIVIINNIYFKNNILKQNFNQSKIFDIIYKNNQPVNQIKKCIEIGHIFQIGQKYSKILQATIYDSSKNKKFIYMGCYGIGITRLVSAIIEQHHDHKGIIWPNNIAPFQVLIIPINFHKDSQINNITNILYKEIRKNKISVLLEDRKERLGIILYDANLIGIPNIIIINQNTIKNNTVEYQERKKIYKKKIIHINNIIQYIIKKINQK